MYYTTLPLLLPSSDCAYSLTSHLLIRINQGQGWRITKTLEHSMICYFCDQISDALCFNIPYVEGHRLHQPSGTCVFSFLETLKLQVAEYIRDSSRAKLSHIFFFRNE